MKSFCCRLGLGFFGALLVAGSGVSEARAEGVDLSAGWGTRAVPLGVAAQAEVGWSEWIWGEKSASNPVNYGYSRAWARYAGSGLVNRVEAGVTVSPWAPIALDAGASVRIRLIDRFATVDCDGLQCSGWVSASFLRVRSTLGFNGFFVLPIFMWEHMTPSNNTPGYSGQGFVDEQSALVGSAGGDVRREWMLIAGASLSPVWRAGYLYQSSNMLHAGSSNRLDALFVGHDLKPEWRLLGGLGLYQSSTWSQGPTAFVRVQWSDLRSPEI